MGKTTFPLANMQSDNCIINEGMCCTVNKLYGGKIHNAKSNYCSSYKTITEKVRGEVPNISKEILYLADK